MHLRLERKRVRFDYSFNDLNELVFALVHGVGLVVVPSAACIRVLVVALGSVAAKSRDCNHLTA